MPAKFVKSYAAPDGQIFPTLEAEKKHELNLLLDKYSGADKESLCAFLVENGESVIECLRQRERKNLTAAKPAGKKRGRPTGTPANAPTRPDEPAIEKV